MVFVILICVRTHRFAVAKGAESPIMETGPFSYRRWKRPHVLLTRRGQTAIYFPTDIRAGVSHSIYNLLPEHTYLVSIGDVQHILLGIF